MKRKIKPKKLVFRFRKNPEQITIPESLFKQTGSRLNSYANVEKLLVRLKRSLQDKYKHLNFEHPSKIFEVEEGLMEILELLE